MREQTKSRSADEVATQTSLQKAEQWQQFQTVMLFNENQTVLQLKLQRELPDSMGLRDDQWLMDYVRPQLMESSQI